MATEMDGTAIVDGAEITAGTSFRFEIDLNPTNVDVEGVVNEDIEDADFATSTAVGCDAEAGVLAGPQLRNRGRWWGKLWPI